MAITKNMVSDNKHVVNQIVTLSKELLFVLFLLALVLVLKPTKASAATINVVAGSSAINADGNCQLEEAVGNINDGTRTNTDCVETGTYGTDDTINLPAGTINQAGSGYFEIDKSANIVGQGRDESILQDVYLGFGDLYGSGLSSLVTATVKDLKLNTGLIYAQRASLTIDNIEIDLQNQGMPAVGAYSVDLTVRNSWFHNGALVGSVFPLVEYSIYEESHSLNIESTTLSQATSGLYMRGGSSGASINANIKNSTFTDLIGQSDGSGLYNVGFGIFAYTEGGDSTINYQTTNNTFSNISNSTSGDYPASAIIESADDNSTINHTAQNDVYAVGDGTSDKVNYYRGIGSGSGVYNATSLGGNITSDNSLASFLAQPTDKHSQTTLADFLGILADNGGPVPTLALLPNSPAIDAGTTASGNTTDARGITRPQGIAFDSGAYELEQTTPEEPGGSESGSGSSNTTTVTDPGLKSPTSSVSQFSNKPITITTPTGTTITSSNTVTESSLGAQDNSNQYPLGLVNFTFNTTQTDNLVTLTFITDLKPNQVKPRKYNPDTKAYTDITNYTLTETTVNGQHALVLTYTITDNGDLDTNKTTGVISDPVGLAMTNSNYDQLANTGSNAVYTAIAGGVMVVASAAALLLTKLKKSTKYLFRH